MKYGLFLARRAALSRVVVCLLALMVCGTAVQAQEKVLRVPTRTDGPKSLDPVRGSTVYDNRCCSQIYQTLLQYSYLKRPLELEPLLLAEMPAKSADGLIWTFRLKAGVLFYDPGPDPCFGGEATRELKASDVVYSWKRLADPSTQYKSYWLIDGAIKGMDEYKEAQRALVDGGAAFDYDAPVEGLRVLSDHEFEVELNESVQQFQWKLGMFQMAIVAREAVEQYGDRFNRHPVGTGPFVLQNERDWVLGQSMVVQRNPHYWDEYYPGEWMPEDEATGLHESAGVKLPRVDRVEFGFFVEDQPRWLAFKANKQDFTIVPDFGFDEFFTKRSKRLKKSWREKGVTHAKVPLLDFIFRIFNMDDELLGGYTEEKKALRQAISLCLDWDEMNETYYWGTCQVYDGMIPPGLDGHPEGHRSEVSYRGPDLQRARELFRKAGYTVGADGKVQDLPIIEYYTSAGALSEKHTALLMRNLDKAGVRVNPHFVNFTTLMDTVDNRKAPMFSFAWHSDYPDGENNLALFYGPNESPGSNHSNYKNAEYDRLYRQIRTMEIGPERTAVYERMRDMVVEDAPFAGSMARTRYYVIHPWIKAFKPTEDFYNYFKYLDVDMDDPRRSE